MISLVHSPSVNFVILLICVAGYWTDLTAYYTVRTTTHPALADLRRRDPKLLEEVFERVQVSTRERSAIWLSRREEENRRILDKIPEVCAKYRRSKTNVMVMNNDTGSIVRNAFLVDVKHGLAMCRNPKVRTYVR